jgi:hypothetical protein
MKPFSLLLLCWTGTAAAFTQSSPITPVGHEWLTVEAAKEVGKNEKEFSLLLEASSKEVWDQARCKACDQYETSNFAVWSTVMGNRWVDIMGFTPPAQEDCLNAVAQDNEEVQYDHFLRQLGGEGDKGREKAIAESVKRFRKYFLDAVAAGSDLIAFTDGGTLQRSLKARRDYFLFGRAAHLFQDSFSLEHADRTAKDRFKTVRDIKSYVCTRGSYQHKHGLPSAMLNLYGISQENYDNHGDVLWKDRGPLGLSPNEQENLKEHANAAYYAMMDLWRAFVRAKQPGADAEKKVDDVIKTWMSIAPPVLAPPPWRISGESECATKRQFMNRKRATCLSVTGTGGFGDPLKPPLDWLAPSWHGGYPDAATIKLLNKLTRP